MKVGHTGVYSQNNEAIEKNNEKCFCCFEDVQVHESNSEGGPNHKLRQGCTRPPTRTRSLKRWANIAEIDETS